MSSDAWQQEKAFLDYMYESLHHNNNGNAVETSTVVTRRVVATPDGCDPSGRAGLDHLDNLCKLMEQLGELRDQNSRLQKRVQYLEDMKTLKQMHQDLHIFASTDSIAEAAAEVKHEAKYDHHSIDSLDVDQAAVVPVLTSDVTSATSSVSAKTPEKVVKNKTPNRFKKPLLLKYRERSKSVGFDEPGNADAGPEPVFAATTTMPQPAPPPTSSASATYLNPPVALLASDSDDHGAIVVLRPKTKVSKWTRVKEAFRWEKAHVDPPKVAPIPSPSASSTSKSLKDEACKSLADEATVGSSSGSSQPSSPMFQLGRVSSNSSSSSSLSECPLESEILKSFADAQQLPMFKLRNRDLSPELKMPGSLTTEQPEQQQLQQQQQQQTQQASEVVLEPAGSPASRCERKSVHQQPQTPNRSQKRRLYRQSTVSCDASFAISCPTAEQNEAESGADDPQLDLRSPAWKRKISRETVPEEIYAEEVDDSADSAGFVANLRSQLRPVNEWAAKWYVDLKNPLTGAECSRNALSVPSSPSRHQSFTFDEFPESGTEQAAGPSDNPSPQSRDTSPAASLKGPESPTKPPEAVPESPKASFISSLAHPGNLLTNISPEFRKKVEAWERIKSGGSGTGSTTSDGAPSSPSMSSSAAATSDKLPPAFKKKLAEWEIRKAVAGKSDQNVEELQKILPQDFNRKLQEWERMKAAGKPASPALERQGSGSKNRNKLGGSKVLSKGREDKHVKMKSEVIQREKQKEKELQWLEKELQKIEREKQRLEREREKYIERETRLEKIREAMRQPQSHREICIRTSTGEFRFQGLSRKFTKKLWQWEEQRGIGPEASTIALLDRAYRPGQIPADYSSRPTSLALGRSKSESSVADLVSASVHSQPSSLSLNDADTSAVASAADFDRRLVKAALEDAEAATEAQGALLVEVEDVVEETAAVVDLPDVRVREPVFAPAEVRQTIEPNPVRHQTSQEDQEVHHIVKEPGSPIQRNDSVRTHDSFQLLEENLSILDRLRAKGEIVKYLEIQLNTIDGDMAGVASTRTEEMDRLKEEEATDSNGSTMERLKQRIVYLENHGRRLKVEKEHLKSAYQKHCIQQVSLVQDLVEKMHQLEEIGAADVATSIDSATIQRLQALTRELLEHVQQLEKSIRQPHKENLSPERQDCGSSDDVSVVVPEQLSLKANQLKEEFRRIRQESDASDAPEAAESLPEMSTADRKKIFVETRRLLFAPIDYFEPPKIHVIQVEPPPPPPVDGDQSIAPWRRHRSTQDLSPWRKRSIQHQDAEDNDSRPSVATSVRPTAPNIRRMIDKYHERIAGRSERNLPSLSLQLRYNSGSGFSTPSPTVAEARTPEPTAGLDDSDALSQPSMIQLSKSQSTGAVGRLSGGRSMNVLPTKSTAVSLGVPRSKSGHQINTVPSTPTAVIPAPEASSRQLCSRNPSFFRKSPLDPSIDELLQKYKGKTTPVPAASLQDPPKSPTNHERAVKLRQAREAFLSVGPGAFHSPSVSPTTPTMPSFPTSDDENLDRQSQIATPHDLLRASLPSTRHEYQPEPPSDHRQVSQQEQITDAQLNVRTENTVKVPVTSPQLRTEPGQPRNPLRAVQMLCRQSLVVDIHPPEDNKAPELGPSVQSCPSSPALSHDGSNHVTFPSSRPSWLKQPRIFFSKPKSP